MEIRLPALTEVQQKIWDYPARFKVIVAGRRFGKTILGGLKATVVALRGGRAWWVAPNYKLATEGWLRVCDLGRQVPGAEVRKKDWVWRFPSGGSVEVRSAYDPNDLRGAGLDHVTVDECAYLDEEAWTNCLRPALSDRQGSAWFIGTPGGRNWFHRLYLRGKAGEGSWKAFQYPTSANPYIPDEEIEIAESELPRDVFRQEYLAEFLEDQGTVFRNIAPNMKLGEGKPEEHIGHYMVMGTDWAQKKDFTVVSVGCSDCMCEVEIARLNEIQYSAQRELILQLHRKWSPSRIICEANAMGQPNIEDLQEIGLPVVPFWMEASTKPSLIRNLQIALEKEEIAWIDDPVGRMELEAYTMELNPQTMRPRYSAPKGMHDDTVIARALMARALLEPAPYELVSFV